MISLLLVCILSQTHLDKNVGCDVLRNYATCLNCLFTWQLTVLTFSLLVSDGDEEFGFDNEYQYQDELTAGEPGDRGTMFGLLQVFADSVLLLHLHLT